MRVLIIEDEAPAYRRLNTLLIENCPDFEVVDVIDSVDDAVKWLRNLPSPDLIFSDIQLADGLSFEIYKTVDVSCPIIFTTAYDEYMLDAFKTNGIDYLLKPIKQEALIQSIEKFHKLRSDKSKTTNFNQILEYFQKKENNYKSRFLIKVGTKLVPIQTSDIGYFLSSDGNTELVARNGKHYIVDHTLDELESMLDPQSFFRLNRQFLSHVESIEAIHQYFKGKLKIQLNPQTNEDVIVSRDKARSFKNWMDGVE